MSNKGNGMCTIPSFEMSEHKYGFGLYLCIEYTKHNYNGLSAQHSLSLSVLFHIYLYAVFMICYSKLLDQTHKHRAQWPKYIGQQ